MEVGLGNEYSALQANGKPKILYFEQNGDLLEDFDKRHYMMHAPCICFYNTMFAQIVTSLEFVDFLRKPDT